MSDHTETAYLASGCFWCTEAVFQQIKGVIEIQSGYSGGKTPNPSYEEVCTGKTGHAETVRIRYDPSVISFKEILDVFFSTHDPTTLNRQGNDVGTQYRSAIFYVNQEQKAIAEMAIKELTEKRIFKKPIVTQIEEFRDFYPSEEYHNNYYKRNSDAPYCHYVISPKLAKLKKNEDLKMMLRN
ncbi:peptide-methionine (S)-S-oxide reductase MsrA [Oxyplasma meridianum]|uniref:Peptide methionine sulfoxide reductase MsrA n=1 Tax=Oxyplasma meridianum TaxID=3073602 RepID=A0AAX4NID8_9ARCH